MSGNEDLDTHTLILPASFRREDPSEQPPLDSPDYRSTRRRAPRRALIRIPQTLTELTGPRHSTRIDAAEADLTHQGRAQGQQIVVAGRVLDGDGRPVSDTLVEIWQANAAGRYLHGEDHHPAPLDPHFTGVGRCVTDREGGYRFTTIKPGAYPWQNHDNAWRPAHIHFSLFGPAFATRLVTQMYFPGDPLLPFDPIFHSIPEAAARGRLVSRFDWALTTPQQSLGFSFDIVLRGREQTPPESG